MSGQGLRIVPYAGHKGYQCYLDGWKVNGKRKRLYFKDETAVPPRACLGVYDLIEKQIFS
jgi:hypothetical protein